MHALAYRPGSAEPESLPLDELGTLDPASLVWVDCEDPTKEELDRLARAFGLHELVLEDLHHASQRTKFDRYADHFHVALHDCRYVDDQLHDREVDVVFGPGWMVSVRESGPALGPAFDVAAVRSRFERQRQASDASPLGLLLWAIVDVVVDEYFDVTEGFDDRIDDLEDRLLDDDISRLQVANPHALFVLSRALVRFRRLVVPLREVISAVLRHEAPCLEPTPNTLFQDLYDHVLRVNDFVESQRDVVAGLRDAQLAVVSNQMSLVQQRIAAWGAILIVATLVTGFLGMNFADAPELGWEAGFGVIVLVMAGLCVPMYLYFRRRRWL